MNETVQKTFYAAVGAPVAVTRTGRERLQELRDRINETTEGATADARQLFEEWAIEGEKFLSTLGERNELDQIQGQVHKLREQLEEMLAAWRESFRPADEKQSVKVESPDKSEAKTKKPADKKAPSSKTAAKKPAAKSTAKATSTKASAKKADKDNEAA